jgi:hypothetical protein
MKLASPLLTLALAASLSGCITTALWGGEVRREPDECIDEVEASFHFDVDDDDSPPLTFEDVGLRILLTPFTLILDCLSFPVQAWIYGWGDDD